MRALELFCGAGGSATGYSRAGFDILGVDINAQPFFPFPFVQADAFEYFDAHWLEFDCVFASPPCQFATQMSARWRGKGGLADERMNLLTPMLERLRSIEKPWVVENVIGARNLMPNPLLLNGGMFGLGVDRPRLFSSNMALLAPGPAVKVREPVGVYGERHDGRLLWTRTDGTEQRAAASLLEAQEAMGMDWADWHGTKEAVPPSYTQFIGEQIMASLVTS